MFDLPPLNFPVPAPPPPAGESEAAAPTEAPAAAPPPPPPPPPAIDYSQIQPVSYDADGYPVFDPAMFAAYSPTTNETVAEAAEAGLDEEGQGLMRTMAGQGNLDRMGANGQTPGQVIVDGLRTGSLDNATAKALLQQVTAPEQNVVQIAGNTCVAAMVQQTLAMSDPATYMAAAIELVNGRPATVGTAELTVSGANNATVESEGLTGPERIDALFQSALMDRGDGGATYDLATDSSTKGNGKQVAGLSEQQAADLCADVLGAPMLMGTAAGKDYEAALLEPPIIYGDPFSGGTFEVAPSREQFVANRLAEARKAGYPGVMVPVIGENGARHLVMVGDVITNKVLPPGAKNKPKNYVNQQVLEVKDASGKGKKQVELYQFYNSVATTEAEDTGIGTYGAAALTGGGGPARAPRFPR